MVPVLPTVAMIEAGECERTRRCTVEETEQTVAERVWDAMLAAAPEMK
jgi:hypothetical protein